MQKGFSRVEVRVQVELEITKFSKHYLHALSCLNMFEPLTVVTVKGNLKATTYKEIPDNCVLPNF